MELPGGSWDCLDPIQVTIETTSLFYSVCFMVDEIGPQALWDQGCGISQIYKSVVCFGKAEFVEGQVEKKRILEKMVQKYVPASYAFSPLKDHNIKKTAVVKIVIESMSGKENAHSPAHTVINNPSPGMG